MIEDEMRLFLSGKQLQAERAKLTTGKMLTGEADNPRRCETKDYSEEQSLSWLYSSCTTKMN